MRDWFASAFGVAGQAIAEARHELLGGWFGRNFEPHPMQHHGQSEGLSPAETLGWDRAPDANQGLDLDR